MHERKSNIPSSLGRAQGKTPMNDEELHDQASRLYETTGSVLFTQSTLAKLPYSIRKTVEEAADTLFGQRKTHERTTGHHGNDRTKAGELE
jgi:hypothetical protein